MKNTKILTLAQIYKNLAINGYRHGLKQPAQAINLILSPIPVINLESVDGWLKENFEIDMAPYWGFDLSNADSDTSHIAHFTWRVSHLANVLLQAIQIPSFDPGYILKVVPKPNIPSTYKVSLFTPAVRHIPFNKITTSFKLAITVLLKVLEENHNNLNSDTVFEELQNQFSSDKKLKIGRESTTICILRSAYSQLIPFDHLGFGKYQLGWGNQSRILERSSTDMDSAIGARMSHMKHVANLILKESGFPVPQSRLINNIDEAIHAAHQIHYPVVIKPADKDRGEGVTTNIDSDALVMEGFRKAAEFSKDILVEEQIPGVCHRIFVSSNKHLFTVKRVPKSVKGDGILTVEELIKKANADEARKPKHKRMKPFPDDDLAMECISSAGFRLDSIPEKDVLVPLRKIESTEWGGTAVNMTETIHPDNIELAIQAARLFRLNVAGIDLMSTDVQIPWHQNGAALNEVNYAPFLSGNSEATKKSLSLFLDTLLPSGGRIPVEVLVGDNEALKLGLARQKFLNEKGIEPYLTTHQATYKKGNVINLALEADSLFLRCRALLMNPEVEGIILVIQTDELVYTGLPVDSIRKIITLNSSLTKCNQPDDLIDEPTFRFLISSLNNSLVKSPNL